MLTFTKEFADLRRTAAQLAGYWITNGRDVFDTEGNRVCTTTNPALAEYLRRLHGYFLPVVNAFVMLHKALRDRQVMTALLARDAAEPDEPDEPDEAEGPSSPSPSTSPTSEPTPLH